MPQSAKPISIAVQDSEIVIWAEVDEEDKSKYFMFLPVFTGDSPPNKKDVSFIGTVQIRTLVYHIYYCPRSSIG